MTEPVVRGRRLGATMRSFTLLSLAVAALLLAGCTVAPGAGGGGIVVVGTVLAGPTCPVQRPGDSACADRPVAGAVLDVTTVGGAEVARVTSDGAGGFQVTLPVGAYVLVPQPVPGLLGTAPPVAFTVSASGSSPASLDVSYDTGIR
ncbi:MAG: hypothetical protein ACYDCI_03585 [Candidatus Limnocylindrales bacterium]